MRSSSVPASVVAEHITWLLARYGATYVGVASAAGVHERTIRFILDADADRGVHRRTANRILALHSLPNGHRLVDARPTRRRAEALSAIGWTRKEVARRAGLSDSALHPSKLGKNVWQSTDRAVARVYDQLRQRPRLDTRGDQARAVARRLGFAPPWTWPKTTIGDVRARPIFSEVENAEWRRAIERRYKCDDI